MDIGTKKWKSVLAAISKVFVVSNLTRNNDRNVASLLL